MTPRTLAILLVCVIVSSAAAAFAIAQRVSFQDTDFQGQRVFPELLETANKAPETAGRLRKPFIADSYGSGLKGGLDWLDRWLGGRWSGRALFFSVMIALAYAWIAFFGGWAAGFVSGDLMGQAVQPVL